MKQFFRSIGFILFFRFISIIICAFNFVQLWTWFCLSPVARFPETIKRFFLRSQAVFSTNEKQRQIKTKVPTHMFVDCNYPCMCQLVHWDYTCFFVVYAYAYIFISLCFFIFWKNWLETREAKVYAKFVLSWCERKFRGFIIAKI